MSGRRRAAARRSDRPRGAPGRARCSWGLSAPTLFRRLDPAGGGRVPVDRHSRAHAALCGLSGVGFPTPDRAAARCPASCCCRWRSPSRRRRLDVLRPRGRRREWAGARGSAASHRRARAAARAPDGWLRLRQRHLHLLRVQRVAAAAWLSPRPRAGRRSRRSREFPCLWQSQHYDLGIAHWLGWCRRPCAPRACCSSIRRSRPSALALLVSRALARGARSSCGFRRAWAGFASRSCSRSCRTRSTGAITTASSSRLRAAAWSSSALVLFARVGARAPQRRGRRRAASRCRSPFSPRSTCRSCPSSASRPHAPSCRSCCASAPEGRRLALLVVSSRPWRRSSRPFGRAICVGALSPLHGFATSVAGGHVPWSCRRFPRVRDSARACSAPGWVNVETVPWSALNRALAPLYRRARPRGLWHAARRPRTRPLAAAAGLLALGAALLRAARRRSLESDKRGHTWNLFKLAQWGWPFVLLLAVLGVRRLGRRSARPAHRGGLALALLVPAEPARRALALERPTRPTRCARSSRAPRSRSSPA